MEETDKSCEDNNISADSQRSGANLEAGAVLGGSQIQWLFLNIRRTSLNKDEQRRFIASASCSGSSHDM